MASTKKISISEKSTSVGIEYDSMAIRAVKLTVTVASAFSIDGFAEVRGDFSKDENLAEGFRKIRQDLAISNKDKVVSCVTGKQVYAAQVPFKHLPAAEMGGALKIHIRKSIPFEMGGSSLDWQIVRPGTDGDLDQVIVSVAARALLHRQLRYLEKAGMSPRIVDVLPLAVANALLLGTSTAEGQEATARIGMHIGPAASTIVIDGPGLPFFQRTIYFAASELFDDKTDTIPSRERARRLVSLGEEITRSISYYEKNYFSKAIGSVFLFGEYMEEVSLFQALQEQTGLSILKLGLASQALSGEKPPEGKFDVAIALALRASPSENLLGKSYTHNLVRDQIQAEKNERKSQLLKVTLTAVFLGLLFPAVLYYVMNIITMKGVLDRERAKLHTLEEEYKKYTATRQVVDKADIELLDSLQNMRIFWTRKLAAIAQHLPDNYWITNFNYGKSNDLKVAGYGYISPQQEQLITLDDYLNRLRHDSTFNDDFRSTYLNMTRREDEGSRDRVSFEYSATNALKQAGQGTSAPTINSAF